MEYHSPYEPRYNISTRTIINPRYSATVSAICRGKLDRYCLPGSRVNIYHVISGHSIFRHLVICQHTAFIDTTITDGNDHVLKLCVKTDRAVLAGILRHLMCDRDDLAFFRLELRRQIYDLFIRFALPVQHPCIIKLLWRAEGNLLIATVRYDKCKKSIIPIPTATAMIVNIFSCRKRRSFIAYSIIPKCRMAFSMPSCSTVSVRYEAASATSSVQTPIAILFCTYRNISRSLLLSPNA